MLTILNQEKEHRNYGNIVHPWEVRVSRFDCTSFTPVALAANDFPKPISMCSYGISSTRNGAYALVLRHGTVFIATGLIEYKMYTFVCERECVVAFN